MSQNETQELPALAGPLATTRGIDGEVRIWGVCRACGYVEEVARAKMLAWQWRALCRTCEDDAIAEAERCAVERAQRAGWG